MDRSTVFVLSVGILGMFVGVQYNQNVLFGLGLIDIMLALIIVGKNEKM